MLTSLAAPAGQLLPQLQAAGPSRSSARWSRPGPSTRAAPRECVVVRAASKSGLGGNVLDRPTTTPGIDKSKQRAKRRPPSYRLLLHNDNYNRREYVVKVLLRVVEGFTVDEAVVVMQEAHINGVALVRQCAQEEAERYCEGMRLNGLISTIEPAGPGSN